MVKRNDRKRSAKAHNNLHGKCGFTLAELLVTMGLLVILTAMVVSFSVLISEYTGKSSEDTDRIGECHEIKEAVMAYVTENDVVGKSFDTAALRGCFGNGALMLPNGTSVENLRSVASISVDQSGKLLKFTITFLPMETAEMTPAPYVFVVAVQNAEIAQGGGNG